MQRRDRRERQGRRSASAWRAASGFTLLETLFVAGLVGVLAVVSLPQMTSGLHRSRSLAAARYIASRMALARVQAAARSAHVALRFETMRDGVRLGAFSDGNGNGVRTVDIDAGVDPAVEQPVPLSALFPGVSVALSDGEEEQEPIGTVRLFSFTAMGTATAGSVYVTGGDGSRWAVRVLGTTARTRLLRYSVSTRDWTAAF